MTNPAPASPDDSGAVPPLNAAKRRHIASAYAMVCHLRRQFEEAGREGRSPSGVGAPLTPLTEAQVEAAVAPLRDLQAQLHSFAAECAPAELAAFEAPQQPRATLTWMSNLLDQMRASVDNLQPRRMAKYGAVGDEEAALLAGTHASLAECVAAARAALDSGAATG